jgi:SET domain-containing protein
VLQVAYRIDSSPIQGLGCFADEPIPAGHVVWRFDPHLDLTSTAREVDHLSSDARGYVKRFACWNDARHEWMLPGDGAIYMNHSESPNTKSLEPTTFGDDVAARDIAAGEELTCDYRAICDECRRGLGF